MDSSGEGVKGGIRGGKTLAGNVALLGGLWLRGEMRVACGGAGLQGREEVKLTGSRGFVF